MTVFLLLSLLHMVSRAAATPAQPYITIINSSVATPPELQDSTPHVADTVNKAAASALSPACALNCHVHFPQVTVWEWQLVQATKTVAIETVYKVVNPHYPNITGESRVLRNIRLEGIPKMDENGRLFSQLSLSNKASNLKKLYFPTAYTEYGTEYSWDGVLPAATAGQAACLTESAKTVQFQPSAPTTVEALSQSGPGMEGNWQIFRQVRDADPASYKSMMSNEDAAASCQADPKPAITTPSPRFGTTYVTTTMTTTQTQNCAPDAKCRVHPELPAQTLAGPPKGSAGAFSPNNVHDERTRSSLAGPSPTAMPIMLPSATSNFQGSLAIGPRPVPISISMSPGSADQPQMADVIIDGVNQGKVGETIAIEGSPPIVITTGTAGLIAIINPGQQDATSTTIQGPQGGSRNQAANQPSHQAQGQSHADSSESSNSDSSADADSADSSDHPLNRIYNPNSPARHAVPITVGGSIFEPLNEHMFLMPDGQELSLNGPAITLSNYGQPDSHKTVLSLVTGTGGSEVLVMDGVSKTLGVDDTAGPQTMASGGGGEFTPSSMTNGMGMTGHAHAKPTASSGAVGAAAARMGRGWVGIAAAAWAVCFALV